MFVAIEKRRVRPKASSLFINQRRANATVSQWRPSQYYSEKGQRQGGSDQIIIAVVKSVAAIVPEWRQHCVYVMK